MSQPSAQSPAPNARSVTMDKIVSLCARRGFIFPASDEFSKHVEPVKNFTGIRVKDPEHKPAAETADQWYEAALAGGREVLLKEFRQPVNNLLAHLKKKVNEGT